ncbi:hypothetical protein Taro_049071 [Colocasia esculenta]|uniref:Myb/SANT-like DNA-binding domain-containing protein n=1 Tax=Colocasia esculenta TaxID=4460 RepID=A0A843XA05_COLES|nr:hypothetical protein [Colocasia esculenta]
MEGNSTTGSMMNGGHYGVLDLQGSMHMHHQQHPHASHHHHQQPQQQQQQQQQQQPQLNHHSHHQGSMVHPPMHEVFPLSGGHMHESGQQHTLQMMDYKGEHGKNSTSDEDEPSFNTEDGHDGHHDPSKGKKDCPWQRMKWTDTMVRLLITAVSYIGEDATSECANGGRRKFTMLQKKGKWKSVAKVMAERGCHVSPQQCEDKFNDLNKRYKKLTDILGRGTSCKVVENPTLLDMMDNLSEKAKDDVRKILSSKHLFYEEMCSYHNGNRLHLPADPALQRSLQLALRSRDEHETRRNAHEDVDEDDQGTDSDGRDDESADIDNLHNDMGGSCFPKRMRLDVEDTGYANPSGFQECNRRPHAQGISVDMNQVFPEGSDVDLLQKQYIHSRSLQLEEEKLHIDAQRLELERQRFKWQRFSRKKDRELEKLRIENERMKLENERLSLELKHKELELNSRST